MTLSVAIGKRVQQLLDERNIKQYYLYKNGGIPKATISETISGKKSRVSMQTIWQICATLEISLAEFFDDGIFAEVTD